MDNYASFISEALEKTKCRECVPSWEEIQMLMSRQEMLCTVHYPGPGSCQLYISSHTTASEVCLPSSYSAAEVPQLSAGLFQRPRARWDESGCPAWRVIVRACASLSPPPTPAAPPGGSQDSGEARPAGEPQHVCAVRAERVVGAAGGRRRSDRRHPDQVGEVKPTLRSPDAIKDKTEQTPRAIGTSPVGALCRSFSTSA